MNKILDILGVAGLIFIAVAFGYYCGWHAAMVDKMALGF